MNDTERKAWNNRPTYSRVLERCEECEQLLEDVRNRENYLRTVKSRCCSECFSELMGYKAILACD